jgi:hypothetical protein
VQEKGFDTVDANRELGLPDDAREYSSVVNIVKDLDIRSIKIIVRPLPPLPTRLTVHMILQAAGYAADLQHLHGPFLVLVLRLAPLGLVWRPCNFDLDIVSNVGTFLGSANLQHPCPLCPSIQLLHTWWHQDNRRAPPDASCVDTLYV